MSQKLGLAEPESAIAREDIPNAKTIVRRFGFIFTVVTAERGAEPQPLETESP